MSQLAWGQTKLYETGCDKGVLYLDGVPGVPWNGLVNVNESQNGGETESLYFDGLKYLDLVASEDFQATIEAYDAPPEFSRCEGIRPLAIGLFATHQPRELFGFSYRTRIGNDLDGVDHGYKIHLVYNATAAPSPRSNATIGQSVAPGTKSWKIDTVPPIGGEYTPTAHLIIDSTSIDPADLILLERHLYGTDDSVPYLPDQDFIIALLSLPPELIEDGGDPTNVDGESTDGGHPGTGYEQGEDEDDDDDYGDLVDGLDPYTVDGEIIDGLTPSEVDGLILDGGTP